MGVRSFLCALSHREWKCEMECGGEAVAQERPAAARCPSTLEASLSMPFHIKFQLYHATISLRATLLVLVSESGPKGPRASSVASSGSGRL